VKSKTKKTKPRLSSAPSVPLRVTLASRRGVAVRQQIGREESPSTSLSGTHDSVIRVYDEAGNVIETHEHAGDFADPIALCYGFLNALD
jgi:hypothetical protein